MIRKVTIDDAGDICEIYNHYVLTTHINFEERPIAADEMASRIREAAEQLPWLVYQENGRLLGYCCATRWKARSAYRYSVETTVYLSSETTGRGIGSELYEILLSELQQIGVRSAVAGIALPNPASVALHEKFGFEKVAHFREIGYKFGQWIDVGYWQLLLSHR